MRILFLHRAFPGQYRYLAAALARQPGNEVVFLTSAPDGGIPGVRKVVYTPRRQSHPATHNYLKNVENAVLHGQAAYLAAAALKRDGFSPDVIYGHSGWGPTLFIADLYPQAPLVCHFEWFYRARGSSFGFDPATPLTDDNEAEIRTKNTPILHDLCQCVRGISPTNWQASQFPGVFRPKIAVIHEGIDTGYFQPRAGAKLVLPQRGLDLSGAAEIVTYVATGMEPLRGFPQFMAAVADLQRRRPACHVVVVGEDRVEYSNPLLTGQTYKQAALGEHDYDLSRLHFTGRLAIPEYRAVLQASTVHVYLTYPFILSWSLLEAMACGCAVVGSDTPPVREVIADNVNGLLAGFFAPAAIADRVEALLTDAELRARLGRQARQTILDRYDLPAMLAAQARVLQQAAGGR